MTSLTPLPLHARIVGAALRTVAVSAGIGPMAFMFGLWRGHAYAPFAGLVLITTAAAFLLERRDARAASVLFRAALAGVVAAVVTPLAACWLIHLGDPDAALTALAGLLREERPALLGLTVTLAVASPLWGLPLLVRARTSRVGPQVLAAALSVAAALLLAQLGSGDRHDLEDKVAFAVPCIASGAIGALAVALLDRTRAARSSAGGERRLRRAPSVLPLAARSA